jgi:hypothetical protein
MLVKLVTNCIEDVEHFICVLIMNSDSTANLNFISKLEYKSVNILNLNLKLGDEEEINRHVSYKYKLVSYQLTQSKKRL